MEFENSQVDYGGKSATSSRIDGGAERCGTQSITSLIHPIEESILQISYPQDIDLIFIRHRVSFPFYSRRVLASPLTFTPGTINNLVPSHREGESYF